MNLGIRDLTTEDISRMWTINEEGLPGVGKVTSEQLRELVGYSSHALGAEVDGELQGFVLCLPPRTEYGSLNYAWFNARYSEFLYVDRIAVAQEARDLGVGTALYQRVFQHAARGRLPVAAEISLDPPNPGSVRFHGRNGFEKAGELRHPTQVVSMVMRPAQ